MADQTSAILLARAQLMALDRSKPETMVATPTYELLLNAIIALGAPVMGGAQVAADLAQTVSTHMSTIQGATP